MKVGGQGGVGLSKGEEMDWEGEGNERKSDLPCFRVVNKGEKRRGEGKLYLVAPPNSHNLEGCEFLRSEGKWRESDLPHLPPSLNEPFPNKVELLPKFLPPSLPTVSLHSNSIRNKICNISGSKI